MVWSSIFQGPTEWHAEDFPHDLRRFVCGKVGVVDEKSIPMPVGIKLEEFSQDDPVGTWPFRELIGSLMWLAPQTPPDIANAVRAVPR